MPTLTYGDGVTMFTDCGHRRTVRWWVEDPLATAESEPRVTTCRALRCPSYKHVVAVVDVRPYTGRTR
jgi:hypothetical protein